VIAQRKQLGGVAFADGETDAKNACVDVSFSRHCVRDFTHINTE
jgi:hypothetical protein